MIGTPPAIYQLSRAGARGTGVKAGHMRGTGLDTVVQVAARIYGVFSPLSPLVTKT
jgi:hypothetical protein